jgi:hypothetical protein
MDVTDSSNPAMKAQGLIMEYVDQVAIEPLGLRHRPAAARRLLEQQPEELPLGLPEQEAPGQPKQQRRFPPLPFPPSTLHLQSRWKGFQREHTKGPDPFL